MPAPRRLVNPEEDEEEDGEEPGGVDTDTFLQQLAGIGTCTYIYIVYINMQAYTCSYNV